MDAVPRTDAARQLGSLNSRSTWSGIGRSAGTKLLVLPLSAALGIVITRLIIEEYGQASYAQYGLLVGIGALLPFADLGVSAAVMNVIGSSSDPRRDDLVRRTLVTAVRVLFASALVIVLVAGAVTLLGGWSTLLGSALLPGSGAAIAFGCLAMIGLTMPVGVGQRVLAGVGRNHVTIALSGLQSPIVLSVLLVALLLDVDLSSGIALVPFIATFVIALLALIVAGRHIAPNLWQAVRDVPRLHSRPGAKVSDVAWPMMVQMLALPLAMQTDRLVLSHVAEVRALAEYNLAAQIWTPIWALVSAAGFTLWPRFAAARAAGTLSSPVPMSLAFGGISLALCVAAALASPWLTRVASGGVISLDLLLIGSFSVLMVLQALKYPLGMFMTDAPGLRYQAAMIVLMLPVNLGLSWYLAGLVGAAGPVIGSVVGVLVFQVLANHLYVRRALRKVRP